MSSSRWYRKNTQVYWTSKALLDGRKISNKTEIREVNGWRLGAMVHRLKGDYEWPIRTEYRGVDNIAYYWLPDTVDRSRLRFPKSAKALGDEGGGGMNQHSPTPTVGQRSARINRPEPRKDWCDMDGEKFSKVEVEHRSNPFAAAYFLTYSDDDSAPAGFVPVEAVNRYIALCGGLALTD